MNKFGISEDIFRKIVGTIEKFPSIEQVYVFGSRARGDFSKGSDLDLALSGENITSKEVNLLQDALDNLNTIISIDIVNIDEIEKEKLSNNIKKEGVLIYDRKRQVKREVFRL
ncbi:nucleotidyltransferase domain-containing protein [Natronospora cellulosivora (SeqCode)]